MKQQVASNRHDAKKASATEGGDVGKTECF